jgi:hypothetical protein
MTAACDVLGLPRIILVEPAPRPLTGRERAIAAHVDHAVAWLDEFMAQSGQSLGKTETGSKFLTDATLLRTDLLNLRRRAIAGEPAEELADHVRSIERSNQQLSHRAAAPSGDLARASVETHYRNTAEAIKKIAEIR